MGVDIPVGSGDVGELYTELGRRLEQIVRREVRAPAPVIEDACQFAWWRLVVHAHRVERSAALSWLVTTAVHEAVKLIRRAERDLSLDAMSEGIGEDPTPSLLSSPTVESVPLLRRGAEPVAARGLRDLAGLSQLRQRGRDRRPRKPGLRGDLARGHRLAARERGEH